MRRRKRKSNAFYYYKRVVESCAYNQAFIDALIWEQISIAEAKKQGKLSPIILLGRKKGLNA